MLFNCATKQSISHVFMHHKSDKLFANYNAVFKRFNSIQVAIIGSGPAGFYTAQKLLKHQNVKIDIREKPPVEVLQEVPLSHLEQLSRQRRRLTELLMNICPSKKEDFTQINGNNLKFFARPYKINANPETGYAKSPNSGRTKVRSIIELMRWHKPAGTILALMPSLWSVGLFTPQSSMVPDLRIMLIFTAGAIVARGMGCTVNDLLDRKYDRMVDRTKMRPIACGDISVKEGLLYLALQSTLGLYILCLNNLAVIKLGLISGLMISIYPLFKRFTYWPQVMLALTMNWGVIMGCAAIKGTIALSDLSVLVPIYLGANFWTLYYDTIYAHQDKTDDLFIGVKSSALKLGPRTGTFLHQMNGGMCLSLALAGLTSNQSLPYYLVLGSSYLYQLNQVKKLDLDDSQACWKMFDRQKYVGTVILGGVLLSIVYNHKSKDTQDRSIVDEKSSTIVNK